MVRSVPRLLLLAWAACSVLMVAMLLAISAAAIQSAVAAQLRQHLLLTLDEAYFSSAGNEVNDAGGLRDIGERLNSALQGMIDTRWYSPRRDCQVALTHIDGTLHGATDTTNLLLALPRNQIDREIGLALHCAPNPVGLALPCVLLGLLFMLLWYLLPRPLSGRQREWLRVLTEQGYDRDVALAAATLPGVTGLSREALAWFELGLRLGGDDIEAALALARAEDSMVIDLDAMSLHLRGLAVSVSGTPLFYYAWYARHRLRGEGWVTNPASNRPDLETGREIAALMARHGGHGRAINDLEQYGLKARTLDQNRSKIKDEIVAVLGEDLAEKYLFESSRHPDGVHTRYRIGLQPGAIQLRP